MKKTPVFTSKRMCHQRYRKTEEAILKVFFQNNQSTMKGIARKAGIGRATIYLHHHAIKDILPDYENYLLSEYQKFIHKKLRIKNIELKTLYFNTLIFISRNQRFFKIFIRFNRREIFFRILMILKSKIESFARLPKNSEKIFKIYTSEISEILFEWGKKGFPDTELEKILSDIIYLTKTSRHHLMPINK